MLANKPELRKALELSLDRNAINKVAFNGEFTADNQMISPSSVYYSAKHPMPERNVDTAKKLIEESGVSNPTVEITYENSLTDGRVAQIIQSMAQEAGFDVNLLPLETSSAIERYLAGNFELYIGNWSGRADPDPTLFAFFGTGGCQNLNSYCNRELDERADRRRARSSTPSSQGSLRAGDRHLSDRPARPFRCTIRTWFFAARASVKGISIYPDGLLRVTGVKPATN